MRSEAQTGLVFPKVYVIIDAVWVGNRALAFAKMLAESGVKLIQYRDKQASSRELAEISQQLQSLLSPYGARFVVNDRADVAAATGAGGVHVGHDDLPAEAARRICGAGSWVGISTHTIQQVRQADRMPVDYIAVGPVFPTSTKETPEPVVGVELIQQARGVTRKPLVAIGGITLEKARDVYQAGADSLAVASDILCAADPAGRARGYLSLVM